MSIERTLSIVKPDGVGRNLIGEVYRRFEQAGLRVVAARMMQLSQAKRRAFTPCIASGRSSRTWCAS
jgi:nucleoside-diphosphate kinase